ncbi:MAG: hypothetical protein KDB52_10010, partial [Solirubrobacterales bacterium]|nr:hypothetical protein [Solirubrobacterales bacterium]
MLRLRADVLQSKRDRLIADLAAIDGVRRLTSDPELRSGQNLISADVEPAAADDVLEALHALDLHHEDFVLVREEVLTQGL